MAPAQTNQNAEISGNLVGSTNDMPHAQSTSKINMITGWASKLNTSTKTSARAVRMPEAKKLIQP